MQGIIRTLDEPGGPPSGPTETPSARTILRQSAPRVLRDALGPIASFFVAWKLAGLVVGIGAATLLAAVIYRHERRAGRPAMVVRVAFALVLIRAVVGLTSGSARVYLGQEAAIDAMLGITVLAFLIAGRPLASFFAREIYPFPDEVRHSPEFQRAFRIISFVWGAYFLARAAVRLTAVLTLSVNGYLLVDALTGAPFLLALLAWSVTYAIRTLESSPELTSALAPADV
jgi:hypothetical protein